MKISKKIDSIDDVEFELIRNGKLKPASDNHNYVNNKDLYKEFIKYKVIKDQLYSDFYKSKLEEFNISTPDELDQPNLKLFNKELGTFIPPKLSDRIGTAIIQIATRRCNSRQYVGYSNNWKEELVANAIMTASIRCHNFDPEKSNNPFAYLTQICDNAIKEQIKKEKKQLYVKYKSIENTNGFNAHVDENNMDGHEMEHQMESLPADQRRKYIDDYEKTNFPGKDSLSSSTSEGGLSEFFD